MIRVLLAALLLFGLLPFTAFGSSFDSGGGKTLPHLDPEMTGAEYRDLFQTFDFNPTRTEFDEILNAGKRNLDWIEKINQARPDDQDLELSTPETQTGYPVEAPSIYSPSIIHQTVADLKSQIPAKMRKILFEGAPLTQTPGLSDESFLTWARKVDRAYQTASRWLLVEPYLPSYRSRSFLDIRGYYFLQKESDLEAKLENWENLPLMKQQELARWLVGLCHNGRTSVSSCQSRLTKAIGQTHGALEFYNRYMPVGRAVYQSFFDIQNARRDTNWSAAQPDRLFVPFRLPDDPEVTQWLKDNIEDEYSWTLRGMDWKLELQFQNSGWGPAYVIFVPGATPHVDQLGGNQITMDANRSIHEYSSRWTIRHEFGHVLGIPDCYTEFYDSQQEVMINYQFDIDNFMCSRRGKFQQRHYDELKRAYFRGR